MTQPRRALYAAGLLTGLLGALLVAWFISGWADVRSRQQIVRDAPRLAAEQRGAALAHELRVELSALLSREVERPYFHYQNLFHDPRGSAGLSVAPSPLAQLPADAPTFVLGYFQVDARRRTTTPTINDDLPELSEPTRLADNRRFRDEVARSLAGSLIAARGAFDGKDPVDAARPRPGPQPQASPQAQVVTLDSSSYLQNAQSNVVYAEQRARSDAPTAPTAGPVTVTVAALEWRTLPYAGQPAMVATRQVDTPDGKLVQGFVIDRTAITRWLASHAGDAVAELRTGDHGAEIVPGWYLAVAANPRAMVAAIADASVIARGFVIRFIAVGALAVAAAWLVVLLVVRAERLARERSQFAAAAAHELRTPLAGLQLYGDMLADGLGDPAKLRDYARRMSEEAARLGRVVSNVLGFSQLERGNLSVDPRPGAVDEAVLEIADRTRPALERAGAALSLDVAPALSARFDRDALTRILGNLLDNAEKYSRGAAERTIELAARAAGATVEIAVTDHGPGVAAAARARLFQPFTRAVGSDGPAGLGLGLALSLSLARAMGGELAYRSSPRGGASFVLTLQRG